MTFYYTETRIPELETFSESQRRAINRGAFDLFRKNRPAMAVLVAGLPGLGAILGFFTISGFLGLLINVHLMIIIFVGCAVGGVAGSYIGMHIFWFLMRPYYRHYIENHRDEIIM